MYAWYICHSLVGAEMEAELLIELLTSLTVIQWGSPDSFDSVRGLGRRRNSWLDEITLYLCCQGRGVLLSAEGAFHVSIHCYNSAWSGHLEFEIGIVRGCIEASECGSSDSAW